MKRVDEAGRSGVGVAVAAPSRPVRRLGRTDIDLWRVRLDQPSEDAAADLAALLSPDEQERARRFYFERDRRRFMIGRGVLRTLLAGYLGCDPLTLVFRYGPAGKPELASPAGTGLQFNLAHSEDLGLYAFTRAGAIGVDVERIRELPDWQFLAATCFPADEQARVRQARGAEARDAFFAAWTRQEARLKAAGLGLGGEVRWTASAGAKRATAAHTASGGYTDGCNPAFPASRRPLLKLYALRVAEGCAATLAVGTAAQAVTCLDWNHAHDAQPARRNRRIKLDQTTQAIDFL